MMNRGGEAKCSADDVLERVLRGITGFEIFR
jgi:hypothetical protein